MRFQKRESLVGVGWGVRQQTFNRSFAITWRAGHKAVAEVEQSPSCTSLGAITRGTFSPKTTKYVGH